jgi:hypothetical protein
MVLSQKNSANELTEKNCLVVTFSRTGATKAAAQLFADYLKCDQEEIFETIPDAGWTSFLTSAYNGFTKKLPPIRFNSKADLNSYGKIILASPIWAGSLAAPSRSFLTYDFPKQVPLSILFTCGSNSVETYKSAVRKDVEEATGRPPIGVVGIVETQSFDTTKLSKFL